MELELSVDNISVVSKECGVSDFLAIRKRLVETHDNLDFEIFETEKSIMISKKLYFDDEYQDEIAEELSDLVDEYGAEEILARKYLTERQLYLEYLEHAHKMRLEYNPNLVGDAVRHFLEDSMEFLIWFKPSHMSRVDVAIDCFGTSLEELRVDRPGSKSSFLYGKSGALETWYSGMRKSDVMIRCYNKGMERRAKYAQGKIMEDFSDEILKKARKHWWRLEFQIRTRKINDWYFVVQEFLGKLYFKSIVQENDEDINSYLKLLALEANPALFVKLSKNSRGKYRKLLNEAKDFSEKNLSNIKNLLDGKADLLDKYYHRFGKKSDDVV